MPEAVLFDPNLLPEFDLASPEFADARGALNQGDDPITDDQASRAFQQCWTTIRDRLQAAWNVQKAAEEAQHAQQEQQRAAELAARQAEEAAEQRELEKKRLKFPPRKPEAVVQLDDRPLISQWALKRLTRHEYVPLYYFTASAASEARREAVLSVTDDETFTFTRSEGGVSLQTASSSRASTREKKDHELTFAEFEEARTPFLETLSKLQWDGDIVHMHSMFFLAVANHPLRYLDPRPLHAAGLMMYLERTRLEWHRIVAEGKFTPTLEPRVDDKRLEYLLKVVQSSDSRGALARMSFLLSCPFFSSPY
ncbi:hypothetical protein EIP86_005468 [Pleurotus ostreatoroseus]|nr:hypothetical protein EIP86_005468 [Pleurotus ostreatoroseus]